MERPDRGARGADRVAIVIPSLGPGGAERVASSLASHWHRSGRRVSIVTICSRDLDAYALEPGVERIALDRQRDSRSLLDGMVNASGRVLAVRRALAKVSPDVVVSFLHHTNVVTLLAAVGSRIPVFVCERSDPRLDVVGRRWEPLRRLLYPRAAGVVVQTEAVGAWARAFCERVHVIPNYVEPPEVFADPGVEAGPKVLVALGRLEPVKGFELLVEAFARVRDRHPDWSLRILGEGPERKRLEALVGALDLRGRAFLPGWVPDPARRLAEAHAFVLSSRYEGFPNALLEAMAAGLPVVAFDCPSGPREIVTHGEDGLLVNPGDVGALAAALDRVMGSAAERTRLGARARQVAVRLSPGAILARWSALLDVGKAVEAEVEYRA